MHSSLTRRRYLAAAAAASAVGVAGCGGGTEAAETTTEPGCPAVTVESPDGESRCVTAVEADRPVGEYYGYDRGGNDSASTPDGLATEDAIVTFVYRNTASGQQSLVTILGDATTSSDGGGNAAVSFEGVSGYQWLVQDGPPAPGAGDTDPYETPSGKFGSSESVVWGWDDNRTDGGAIGPLGDAYEITVTSLAEGTVGGRTQARKGLDRWVLVDGANPEENVELAGLGSDAGDVSITVRAGRG